jgi:hypothetical protein
LEDNSGIKLLIFSPLIILDIFPPSWRGGWIFVQVKTSTFFLSIIFSSRNDSYEKWLKIYSIKCNILGSIWQFLKNYENVRHSIRMSWNFQNVLCNEFYFAEDFKNGEILAPEKFLFRPITCKLLNNEVLKR